VPPFLTAQITTDALRAGKHVLAEKPMANTVAEALRLVRVWRESGCKYMVGEQFFFGRAFERLREMARADDWPFGRPQMVELHQFWKMSPLTIAKYYHSPWRHDKRLTWGYLLEGGCHTANPLREAFGMPRNIQSRLLSVDKALGVADTIIANFDFPRKIACHLVMAYGFKSQSGSMLEIFAKAGTITLAADYSRLLFAGEDGREWSEDVRDELGSMHREWLHFFDVVANDKPLQLTPEQTRDDLVFVQRLIDAAN